MNLAVWYDYLETIGGGERVALTLADFFNGTIVTTSFDPRLPARAGIPRVRIQSLGDLARGPPMRQLHASWRFARARLPGYDFHVFIGNWAHFAARRHHPNLYYCLTPTRAFYDLRDATLARLSPVRRAVAWGWQSFHRTLDQRAIRRVDRIVAISENVRNRIRRFYHRDASVIHPPVRTKQFQFLEVGDTWLSVNRLYPEKRIELQLEVFRHLPREKLVIVGGYTEGDLAGRYVSTLKPPPNVTFLSEVTESRLVELYGRCRGLVTAAVDEDFGITPVEAMAAGKCVVAADEGGYRETVVHGETGFLLPPKPDAFVRTIQGLDDSTLRSMRDTCIARARRFDESVFLERIQAAIGG